MSLTQVGKALWAAKLSQETCLLRSHGPTGDGLAFARTKSNIEAERCSAYRSLPRCREIFLC